jgi:hypothetical protein
MLSLADLTPWVLTNQLGLPHLLKKEESRGSVAGESNSVITLDNKSHGDLVWGKF